MPHSVLNEELVRRIRAMQRPGVGAKKIMRALKLEHLSEHTVHAVLDGRTWQHVR